MTEKEYQTKKRELELKLKILNIEQKQNYKSDQFQIFLIISAYIIICCVFALIYG